MTERKIQDYLHLYGIDCPIMTPDGLGSVLVIYPKAVEVCLNVIAYQQEMKGRKGGGEMYYKYFYPDVKLVLRPLSDMTEQEALGLCSLKIKPMRVLEIITISDDGIEFKYESFEQNRTMYLCPDELSPEMMRLLLKNSFDLFNLIESGLAINKSTL